MAMHACDSQALNEQLDSLEDLPALTSAVLVSFNEFR